MGLRRVSAAALAGVVSAGFVSVSISGFGGETHEDMPETSPAFASEIGPPSVNGSKFNTLLVLIAGGAGSLAVLSFTGGNARQIPKHSNLTSPVDS
jgi:hypothetical protein